MPDVTISLAEAKARLSELAERPSAGKAVVITRRRWAIARIRSLGSERKPIDPAMLRAVTQCQRGALEESPSARASIVCSLRDDARY